MFVKKLLKAVYEPQSNAKTQPRNWRKYYALAGLVGSIIGWYHGKFISETDDLDRYITKFESMDQLYAILEREKKPVFYYYYVPGEPRALWFRSSFAKSARLYHDKVVHTMINCNKNYDICKNQVMDRYPKILMIHPPIMNDGTKVFPESDYFKHYSMEGIQRFFEENGVLTSKDYGKEFMLKFKQVQSSQSYQNQSLH
eukprot:TRINITY_DN6940_c0_g1_i13.p1 TRINITY_DN6940_c0_g1~~TRINITY_DN6940_c0_g1_i13.p1  ORF type:complete len:199 (-),score=3.66 TRINITY_DN6940_c0_g1_i13:167-763(-)